VEIATVDLLSEGRLDIGLGRGHQRYASARPRREPAPPAETRVLPMQLKVGDRLVDETVMAFGYTPRQRPPPRCPCG
jgi:alkanesulfonate monooxygenase SsuD/methylene tetrahydromethanopterin reductase-like flavin-dependent oxidoreductase (luciferase family)